MRDSDTKLGRPLFPLASALARGVLVGATLTLLAPSAVAQLQFDELRKRHLPPRPDISFANPSDLVLGDVDGDGDLDLVLANGSPDPAQNRLYVNDGTGTFTDATHVLMPVDGDFTRAVAMGDVDGDGDPDLVFGNNGHNKIYLNDGTGTFTDATACLPLDLEDTWAIGLGDVDGDGDLDLVIANDGKNRLYLNDGAGIFTDETEGRLPLDTDDTRALALGDVDGDGDPDLVMDGRLYLNDGAGTFTDVTAARMPPANIPPGLTRALALSDVDGDGDSDLVFARLLLDNLLYINDGTGTFTDVTASRMPPENLWAGAMALGDVDEDGDPDLILGGFGLASPGGRVAQLRLYLNDGGTFTEAAAGQVPFNTDSIHALAMGDVDGDGDSDLVLGHSLYLNLGAGTFTDATASRLVHPLGVQSVALGDVDGDGDADLVLGNYARNLVFLNDGTGRLNNVTGNSMPPNGSRTEAVAMHDVDGDGDLDLVLGNIGIAYPGQSGQQNHLYLNDGNGQFTDATDTHMPFDSDHTRAVAVGDVDGDGDPDLVFGNALEENRLYLNDGTGTFTDATASRLPTDSDNTFAVALGDVDGDGDADLVFGNAPEQNRLYLNDGTGIFTDATASHMPLDGDDTQAVMLGDVDGDGDPDLVIGNGTYARGQPDRLYLNDGTGIFTDVTSNRMPSDTDYTRAVRLGDVDEDGDPDLVIGNRLYLNDGDGVFTDVTDSRMPARGNPSDLALGDVDGDGDLDLVASKGVYFNLLRQLDTPFLVIPGREYRLDAYARYGPERPGDLAFIFVSTGRATHPLPPFGTIGLDVSRAIGPFSIFIRQPSGMSSVSFKVPDNPGLIGVSVYAQALLVPFGSPWRLTNVTADRIMR